MSWLARLFGRTASASVEQAPAKPTAEIEYQGFTIRAEPYPEGGQFQTAGTVVKSVDGEVRTHRFVRADRFASVDDATEFAVAKGKQIVDQQGERMFAPREGGAG